MGPSTILARPRSKGTRALLIPAATHAVERWSFALCLAFAGCFIWLTCRLAAAKAIWHDEFYTYYLAKLPPSSVWPALADAVDTHPPVFFWITHAFFAVFGESHVSLRLPGILGLCAAGFCLYFFVRRRTSGIYGLAAFLLPLLTEACTYSYEARPYGLLLAFCAAALLAWQRAEASRFAAAALCASLALAISCHYYAALMYLPLAGGETVRTWRSKRIAWHVWAALGAGGFPLLVYRPLIAATREAYPAPPYLAPRWTDFGVFYVEIFYYLLPIAVAALILFVLWPPQRDSRPRINPIQTEDLAAATGTVLLPIAMLLLAKLATNAMAARYALETILGLAILIPFALYRASSGSAVAGTVLSALIACGIAANSVRSLRAGGETAHDLAATCDFLLSQPEKSLPIVAVDANLFLKLRHYGPEEIRRRLVYVVDPDRSTRHIGDGSVDLELQRLAKRVPLQIRSYDAFVGIGQPFLLFGYAGQWNWIVSALTTDEIRPVLNGRYGDLLLFMVPQQRPPGPL